MKNAVHVVALMGLIFGGSLVFAEVTYGPVITIKPKGATEEGTDSRPKPESPQDFSNKHNQKRGLLLPAVQKNSDSGSETAPGTTISGQAQEGNLDRDIIRRVIREPKPKPDPK